MKETIMDEKMIEKWNNWAELMEFQGYVSNAAVIREIAGKAAQVLAENRRLLAELGQKGPYR